MSSSIHLPIFQEQGIDLGASVVGENFVDGANQRNGVVQVRNNLSTQRSDLQTIGSDIIEIEVTIDRASVRTSSISTLKLQFIDSTGTALDSDTLPASLDFSAFDNIRLLHTRTIFIGSNFSGSVSGEDELSAEVFLTDSNIDDPVLSVSASPVNEGLIGFPVTFTLSSPAQGGERFSFALESDQANIFEDFQPFEEFHEFAAGETSLELLFTLTDDATIEPDENLQSRSHQPGRTDLL